MGPRRLSRWRLWVLLLACPAAAHAQCPPILPAFTWYSAGHDLVFIDQTQAYGVNVDSRQWHFGDGGSSADAYTTHGYASSGLDTVRLVVHAGGCVFVGIGSVPHGTTADNCDQPQSCVFTATQASNNVVTFQDASSGQPDLFAWSFGDGYLDLQPSLDHTFLFPGKYDVTHTVAYVDTTQQNTCSAGNMQQIEVDGNASTCDSSLFLSASFLLDNNGVLFNVSAVPLNPDLQIGSLQWDFGDGSTDVTSMGSTSHIYYYDGPYQACISVHGIYEQTQDTCSAITCVTLNSSALTGVPDRQGSAALRAHPVPCDDRLTLTGEAVLPGATWSLIDVLGRTARSGTLGARDNAVLDLDELQPGLYKLRLLSQGRAYVISVIEQ